MTKKTIRISPQAWYTLSLIKGAYKSGTFEQVIDKLLSGWFGAQWERAGEILADEEAVREALGDD